ncbi:macrophage mannose receptor 1-like [Mytilus edulis]|uniref:macrophage mannose receptor 1-like n=1 Tax=Mytilus edulis TaxID=6550 RepID=UPI0039EDEBDA
MTIRRNNYLPITFPGSITFGNSKYSIIPEYEEWENAKENCKCLGGKLVELETSEENEFIKDEVRTLNTGVEGFWIGGYNFNHDDDMEWISKPNQGIPFSDMHTGQPNHPTTELCMMIWRSFDFRWGDHYFDGYWIGGYNFNHDDDMEWISKPILPMPFTDMDPGQPNGPVTQLLPITSTRSISFGNSKYSIIEESAIWQKANESCKCFGGKLLELETSEENEFIKNEVRTLNTGVEGYWVGGYNFNHDHDMEWLSKPNQVMPFSNMESGEPNYPAFQPCMMIFRDFDFRWGDHYCSSQLSYICEFQNQ